MASARCANRCIDESLARCAVGPWRRDLGLRECPVLRGPLQKKPRRKTFPSWRWHAFSILLWSTSVATRISKAPSCQQVRKQIELVLAAPGMPRGPREASAVSCARTERGCEGRGAPSGTCFDAAHVKCCQSLQHSCRLSGSISKPKSTSTGE